MAGYISWILAILGGYLIGSIPFGVLVTKAAGVGDIRQVGSGNIGATNVLRTGRRDLAIATLAGDMGKGFAVVIIARLLSDDPIVVALAGGAAFVGHVFPVWLKFNGGKGVATFFGVLLAAWFPAGVFAAVAWLVTAFLFRISSLAALIAAALSPFLVLLTDGPLPMLYLALLMAALIFLRHRENIGRLLKGEEPRIGKKSEA